MHTARRLTITYALIAAMILVAVAVYLFGVRELEPVAITIGATTIGFMAASRASDLRRECTRVASRTVRRAVITIDAQDIAVVSEAIRTRFPNQGQPGTAHYEAAAVGILGELLRDRYRRTANTTPDLRKETP
ncbi:hypothetical protein [Polymorphospora rubra]|nr:hypothetical protein [Polymorphospora rubra]